MVTRVALTLPVASIESYILVSGPLLLCISDVMRM